MEYIFYFRDRFGTDTHISEPEGWDAMSLVLKRDKTTHGLFFDLQNDAFKYRGKAAQMLRDEWDMYGIQGYMQLVINFICASGEENLDTARFSFAQWDDEFGDDCAVTLPVESTTDIMTFRNRFEQKVNLLTTTAFDGSALPAYSKLPFTQTLPGKSIFVADEARNNIAQTTFWDGTFTPVFGAPAGMPGNPQMAFFVPGFANKASAEIGGFVVPDDATESKDEEMDVSVWSPPATWIALPYSNPAATPYDQYFPFDLISPVVNYDKELGGEFGTMTLQLEGLFDTNVSNHSVGGSPTGQLLFIFDLYLGILLADQDPADAASWDWKSATAAGWSFLSVTGGGVTAGAAGNKAFSYSITLNPGDRIYYFYKIFYRKDGNHPSDPAFDITYNAGSYFKLSGLSHIADTTAQLCMVNESLSRIAEAITDGRMRAYSEFYGRTDSEPYAVAADGCGSLTAITPGLFVRRMEQKLTTTPPIFTLSMKDAWDGLAPIHNIGMGIEPDPYRDGFSRLRFEPWNYFYTDDVILECIGVASIHRKIRLGDHYATFKFGYDKWEAEAFNGIDEFITQRQYRTELTQTSSVLSALSTFVASVFAIEVTRRKGNDTSEDWRYDKETFVIAMKRSGSDIVVELGGITGANHIVDPASIYNFRLRPAYIALRWLPQVLASYRLADAGSRIIFTDGTGNVYAEGTMTDGFCPPDNGIATSEKEDYSPGDTADVAAALPIWYPEDIIYEYPMTAAQWKALRAMPRGLIYYETDGLSGYGWIETVEYKPEAGIAAFTLTPKRT